MDLLPQEVKEQIPPLSSQENNPDPMVWVKFFDPASDWRWYVLEGSPWGDDYLMFGWVVGFEKELGHFLLSEFEDLAITGVGVKRDEFFVPCPLSEVRRQYREPQPE